MSSRKFKLRQDTTRYLLEWPKFRTLPTPKTGEDVELEDLSFTAGGNAKWKQAASWDTVWKLLRKLNILLPYDSAFMFLIFLHR